MNHYINGEWIEGKGKKFSSTNPADEKTIWSGRFATEEEVKSAVDAANKAQPSWAGLALEKRLEYLNDFANILEQNKERFAELISREVGKPLWESNGEVAAMLKKVSVSVRAFNERCHKRSGQLSGSKTQTRYKPHGVVAVFSPFNFPGHLANGHIVPALIAGNTIILKPSEQVPLVSEYLVKLWEQAKLPKGVLNLVQGEREAGIALSSSQDVDAIFFTGSTETGLAIHRAQAGNTKKILALEMGGNNPLLVWDIKDYKAAAYQIIQSGFITSGQRCTCARRLILEEKISEKIISEIEHIVSKIQIGPFTDENIFMGPVINQETARRLLAEQDNLLSSGAKSLIKMDGLDKGPSFLTPGLIDVSNQSQREDKEIFGPLLQVIRTDSFEHAIKESNNTSFGLAASILSNDSKLCQEFYQKVNAGIININRPTTGASSEAPFGGIGLSGNHRPSAFFAADYCSYPVASIEESKLELPKSLAPGISLK